LQFFAVFNVGCFDVVRGKCIVLFHLWLLLVCADPVKEWLGLFAGQFRLWGGSCDDQERLRNRAPPGVTLRFATHRCTRCCLSSCAG
jgi:hypothetical protein